MMSHPYPLSCGEHLLEPPVHLQSETSELTLDMVPLVTRAGGAV